LFWAFGAFEMLIVACLGISLNFMYTFSRNPLDFFFRLEFSMVCKILQEQFCSWCVLGNVTASEGFRSITTTAFSNLAPSEISWR